jgi:hypothetical protein
MRSRAVIAFSVMLLIVVSACSQGASAPATRNESLTATVRSHCTDVNAPELGEGTLCIDNGFRLKSDDFSFKNWGRSERADANVTVQTLIDLFGHTSICMPGNTSQCVLRPTTIQKLEQWNNALSGGRCEGLATLSNRMFLRYDNPSDFSANAQKVSDINQDSVTLTKSSVYWWATQFLPEVIDRAAQSRTLTPLELVDDLIQGLANGLGYTLSMYYGSTGHTVTPFAVTQRKNTFVVHVYDNNFPGERREITVDATSNSWTYPEAVIGIDGTGISWSGNQGTLELVPMSARQGPFTCSFCLTDTENNQTTLSIASRDPQAAGYLFIQTRRGNTLEVTPDAIVSSIPGATFEIGKGRQSGVTSISLPADTGDFDVFVRRGVRSVPAGDVVVNIQRLNAPSIQVSGNLATSVIGEDLSDAALLNVREKNTEIHAPQNSNARVSVAVGNTLSKTNLERQNSLIVERIAAQSIEVSLKGSNNEKIASSTVESSRTQSSTEVTLLLDTDRQIVSQSARISPVPVQAQTQHSFSARQVSPTPSSTAAPSNSIVISEPD